MAIPRFPSGKPTNAYTYTSEQLDAYVEAATKDALAQQAQEIATLKADLDKWKAEASYVVQHVKDRNNEIADLRAQLATLTAERDELAAELKALHEDAAGIDI